MAITTVGVYLGYATPQTSANLNEPADTYTKLCDITDFPDMEGELERTETTTLSEKIARTYKKTLRNSSDLVFTANYNKAEYLAIQKLQDTDDIQFCLLLEQDNSLFYWAGDVAVGLTGGGLGETVRMNVTCVASKPVRLAATGGQATNYYYNESTKEISTQAPV